MNSRQSGTEAGSVVNAPAAEPPRKTRKPTNGRATVEEGLRFFLTKAASNGGLPQLGQECATEDRAIARSYKEGVPYLVIEEKVGIEDPTGKVVLVGVPVGKSPREA